MIKSPLVSKGPIIDDDLNISLDNDEQVESVVLMSRVKD